MTRVLRVAAVQHDVAWEQPDVNRERLAARVAGAAAAGARLVVLSEMFATGFTMATATMAEARGGPTGQWMIEQAERHGVWLLGSVAEVPAPGALPTNTAVLAGPRSEVHRYDKIHPFSYAGEHEHYAAGSEPLTVEVEGVRVTPLVCYDLRFADLFWECGPGTDLFVVPANWPASRRHHWRSLLVARAIENQCWVVGVNRVGEGDGLTYSGDSCVVDPMGEVVAAAAEVETTLVVDVDPERVADVRRRFPFHADRRPAR